MDDDIRALLSPEGERQYLREAEADDFHFAEIQRRRLAQYPEPEAEPPQRTASPPVTWRQLDVVMSFLGGEVGKTENRLNLKIRVLEEQVAALRCDVEVLSKHKASKSDIVPLRGRDVA